MPKQNKPIVVRTGPIVKSSEVETKINEAINCILETSKAKLLAEKAVQIEEVMKYAPTDFQPELLARIETKINEDIEYLSSDFQPELLPVKTWKINKITEYLSPVYQRELWAKIEEQKNQIIEWNINMKAEGVHEQAKILNYFKRLDAWGMNLTLAQLGGIVTMSPAAISSYLKIFQLPDYVQQLIKSSGEYYKFLSLVSFQRFYKHPEINKDGKLEKEVSNLVEKMIREKWVAVRISEYVDERVKQLGIEETKIKAAKLSKVIVEQAPQISLTEYESNLSLAYNFAQSLKKIGEETIPLDIFEASENILPGINLVEIYDNALKWRDIEKQINNIFLIKVQNINSNETLSPIDKKEQIKKLEEGKNQTFFIKKTFEQEALLLEGLVWELSKHSVESRKNQTKKWIKKQINDHRRIQANVSEEKRENYLLPEFGSIKDNFLQATIVQRWQSINIPIEGHIQEMVGSAPSTIRLRLFIFELPQKVQEMIKKKEIVYSSIEGFRRLKTYILEPNKQDNLIISLAEQFAKDDTNCADSIKIIDEEIAKIKADLEQAKARAELEEARAKADLEKAKERAEVEQKKAELIKQFENSEEKILDLINKVLCKNQKEMLYLKYGTLETNIKLSNNKAELINSVNEYNRWIEELNPTIKNVSYVSYVSCNKRLRTDSAQLSNRERPISAVEVEVTKKNQKEVYDRFERQQIASSRSRPVQQPSPIEESRELLFPLEQNPETSKAVSSIEVHKDEDFFQCSAK